MIFCLKKITLFGWLCLLGFAANGQKNKTGNPDINAADSLYNHKQFKQASNLYFVCFKQNALSKTNANLFNAAKACAKSRYVDSAWHFLFTIVKQRGDDLFDQIVNDPDFKKMHADERWIQLLVMIDEQQNNAHADKIVGDELIALRTDRVALEEKKLNLVKQYGSHSKKAVVFKDSLNKLDSVNCYKLKSIINTYGWLGYKAIGSDGVQSEIYLYQKANIAFQKLHFPVIAEAFKSGNIDALDYAIIADGISLYDTGRQIYGTQLGPAKPSSTGLLQVENKDSVNMRRRLIGLGVIE